MRLKNYYYFFSFVIIFLIVFRVDIYASNKKYYLKKTKNDYSTILNSVAAKLENIKDNEIKGWGIVVDYKTGKNISNGEILKYKQKYNIIYRGDVAKKVLYLTFDEGYENGNTNRILDILKKKNVKATFFITGWYLESQPQIVKRIISDGHTLGNHTIRHYNMAKISNSLIVYEILELHERVKEMFGYEMKYFRPPEGVYNEKVLFAAHELGYKTVFWSFAYEDWKRDVQRGKDYTFNKITKTLHDGEVFLLHAVSKDNTEALEDIIDYAIEKGYTFEVLENFK